MSAASQLADFSEFQFSTPYNGNAAGGDVTFLIGQVGLTI